MVSAQRRRQRDLFEETVPQRHSPAHLRAPLLDLLQALLIEAATPTNPEKARSAAVAGKEARNDKSHG
jgi:hypothetical protein